MKTKNLADQYRPKSLADLVGQARIRRELQSFAAMPYSANLLFSGPPGVGKTSAALALANELGCHPTSGVWQFNGTDLDEDTMDGLVAELRFAPMGGGWRVIIVDEADWIVRAPKIYTRFNSLLESEPTKTVFVFTSNHAEKFSERFLERVEHMRFEGDNGAILLVDAQELVDTIWAREGTGPTPRVADLPGVINDDGALSFRRVVRALEPMLRPMPSFKLGSAPAVRRNLFSVGTPGRSAAMFT